MSGGPKLQAAAPYLDTLLGEMILAVLGEESLPIVDGRRPATPTAASHLVIHDLADDSYLAVEIRASAELVSALAAKLLGIADPSPDDMLDVIAEFGNIAAGNVKTLLCTNGRLSLPASALQAAGGDDPVGTVRAGAELLDQVLELVVMPLNRAGLTVTRARWPGAPLPVHAPAT